MIALAIISIPLGSMGAPGSETRTLVAPDGITRSYRLYRGAGIQPGTPAPLLVLMHGLIGSATQAERSYKWNELADRLGYVVAYPEGIGNSWNAGDCCGAAGQRGVDDVGFLASLLDEVTATEGVDPDRIFAAGISNGAMMSYRLACDLPGRLAAIASVAGTMVTPCESPSPISVLEIHGTGDSLVPYEGAERNSMRPIPGVMQFWRDVGGCSAPESNVVGPVTVERSSCDAGRSVTLIRIERGTHVWPVASRFPLQRLLAALGLRTPDRSVDGSTEMSKFFQQQPRVGAGLAG
ncbi:MAG: PHB depolymerase family esterase [Actinomycetota bacterium]